MVVPLRHHMISSLPRALARHRIRSLTVRHTNYDAIAATYDRRYSGDDYAGIERALLDFIGTTSITSGGRLWDRPLASGAERGILRPTGLDLSLPMLSSHASNCPLGA